MRLLQRLEHHAQTRPEQLAFCEINEDGQVARSLSFAGYARAVTHVAARLDQLTPDSATILIQLPNRLAYPVVYLATLAAGWTVFPLHPALTPHEVAEAGDKCGASHLVTDRDAPEGLEAISLDQVERWLLEGVNDAAASSIAIPTTNAGAMLLQSSGTTGLPKIVRRTAASIDAVAENIATSVVLTPSDNVIAAVPLCHSYGIENGVVGPLWAGSTVYACPGFEPQVVSGLWSRLDSVVLPMVPIMIDLLGSAEGLALPGERLRAIYSAGATLPAAVAERFEQRFKHGVGHLYGATEIGSVTYGEDGRAHDAGWVGRPMTGVSIRILDVDDPFSQPPLSPGSEGQVAVRAPSMLQRYLGDEPLPMVEGHYLTGDLGLLDEYGGLTLTGRLKALIDIGGMKVNAMEVERVLTEHAGVAECVVVPARITDTLSRLTAFVIPADPANPPTANALRAHAKARLAAYKVPRAFTFVDSLPRTSLGKVQRRKLTGAKA